MKYCSMSQRKFSKSLAFRAPPKVLGSGTHTFAGGGSAAVGVSCTTARFSNTISPSRDLIRSSNSSVMACIRSWNNPIRSSVAFSRVSIDSRCESSCRTASATESKGWSSPQLLCLSPRQAWTPGCLPRPLSLLLAHAAPQPSSSRWPSLALIPTVTRLLFARVRRLGTR